jgi:hypothetical protein
MSGDGCDLRRRGAGFCHAEHRGSTEIPRLGVGASALGDAPKPIVDSALLETRRSSADELGSPTPISAAKAENEPGDECRAGLSKAPVEGQGRARRRGGQPDVAAGI